MGLFFLCPKTPVFARDGRMDSLRKRPGMRK
nr:MAG TPA: hypothetical protein [Caudoviricetes sp.]